VDCGLIACKRLRIRKAQKDGALETALGLGAHLYVLHHAATKDEF
jgi:hypothetical protein